MKIYEIGLADDSMIKITNDDDSFIALVPKGYLSIRGNPHPNFVYVYINAFQFEPIILGYNQILKQDGSVYGNSVAELLMNISSTISFEQSKDDILQNGNSFGTGIIIGSKDNFSLNFKTNNTNRLGISSSGTINIPQFSGLGSKLLGIDNSGNLTSVFGIIQNGNSFGSNVVIGTNDTYDLVLETNNIPRLLIKNNGIINIPQFSGNAGNHLTLDVSGNIVSSPPLLISPTLQQVTDVGSTTTNDITVLNSSLTRVVTLRNNLGEGEVFVENHTTNEIAELRPDSLSFYNSVANFQLRVPALTSGRTQNLQDASGTIALTSDIANALSGYTALINVSKVFSVSKLGNDTNGNGSLALPYLTIKKAVDEANLIASITNPISVLIDTGIYLENTIVVNSYVFIRSSDQDSIIIRPNDNTLPLFQLTNFTGLSFLTIEGVLNTNAIEIDNASEYCVLHKLYIRDSYRGVLVNSTTSGSYVYLEYVSVDNSLCCGIEAISTTNITELSCENTYAYNIDSLPSVADVVSNGTNTKILFHSGSLVNQYLIGTNTGFLSINSGSYRIRNMQIEGYQYGVYTATGTPNIIINACTFDSNTYNFYIDSPTATGYFQGYSDYSNYFIHSTSNFFVSNSDSQIVTVAKKGGNFTSVKAAVNSILDASSTKRYIVQIGTGIFIEDTITMKPFVDVRGLSFTNSIIQIDNVNKNTIIGSPNSGLFELQLRGSTGTGVSAIVYTGGAGVFRCFGVRFGVNYRFYNQNSTTAGAISIFQSCSAEATSNFTTAFEITDNGVNASTFAFNTFTYTGTGNTFIKAYGTLTAVSSANYTVSKTVTSGYGIHTYNGANISINAVTFQGFSVAFYNENTGTGVSIFTGAFALRNNINDIQILSPTSTGSIFGFFTLNKCTVDNDANISLLFTDVTGQGTASLGKFWIGSKFNNLFDAKDLITSGSMGLHYGGDLTTTTGRIINITAGYGYLEDDSVIPEIYKKFEWNTQILTIPANSDVFVYFNTNNILTTNVTRPTSNGNIILGRVFTDTANVIFISKNPNTANHLSNKLSDAQKDVFGTLFVSGSGVVANSSRQILVSSGVYYLGENKFLPNGKAYTDSFTHLYKSATPSVYTYSVATDIVLNDKYDTGTGTLVNATAGYYVKHSLYLVKDTVDKYFLLVGQTQNALLVDAVNASNPTPPNSFRGVVVLIANIITKQGDSTFTQIIDARPVPLFRGTSTAGVTSHSDLSNLSANDHLQYLLKAGDVMTGNLDMGGNNITNVNIVDGVDISAHATRHLPNGADSLATAAPTVNLGGSSVNSVGIQNSFSRSDHCHTINVANTTTTGLLTLTDWNIFNNKQAELVSGTNIKTIEGQTLLGIGNIDLTKSDVGLSNVVNVDTSTTTNVSEGSNLYFTVARVLATLLSGFVANAGVILSTDTILQAFNKLVGNIALKLTANTPITASTKTKITYDSNGLITAGNDATTADIADSTNKRYVSDANLVVIGNTSGINSGDNATNSQYSGLVSNATHTGDATGATVLTLATVNSNVGTFGNATNTTQQTVNGKGLVTAISNIPIQITESQVTNLISDLGNKQNTLVSGTNIKTVNSTSLLGLGNLTVEPPITAGTTLQYYRGDKTFQTLDKISVGLSNVVNVDTSTTTNVSEGSNLYFTLARVLATTLAGFASSAGTISSLDTILQAFNKLVGNIALKLTANTAIVGATKTKITYDSNGLITAGTDATTADIADSINKRYQTNNQQTFNDATSSIQTQLNAKITSGSSAGGDLSGTYPNPAILNSVVLAKLLTGLNITGSSIVDTDNLLQAFGKLQSQINGVLGGAIYQAIYNATTNTPTLIDGTGIKGNYYVVSVAGVQNFGSGSIDFNIGDWAIYNGTIWQKVDNTDAVASVNGFIGSVNLTSANISEVTNLYFTATRAIASQLSGYVSGVGVISATDTILQAIQKLNGNIVALTTANITASLNKRYVTDANLVVIGNTSGTNTGDNATNNQYSGLLTTSLFQARFFQQSGNITSPSVANTYYYYSFSASGQLTLPTAISNTSTYHVKNTSNANITVVFTSGQNADGSTTITIIPNQSLIFISNNINYDIN